MKIYALVYESYIDGFDGDHTSDVYLGFYATKELAKKANRKIHRGQCEVKEIVVKESEE